MRDPLPPLLKWAGGKRWLLPTLTELYAPYRERTYVSIFAGGSADAFGLAPLRAIVNDINPHLINFYRWVAQGADLKCIEIPLGNDRDTYLRNRQRFGALASDERAHSPEAAMLFYYLNKAGYNGLCRFNQHGQFNVPFGNHKHLRLLPFADKGRMLTFTHYSAAMHRWHLSNLDFAEVDFPDGAFVYADPPYDDGFTGYSRQGFSWNDQVRLVHFLADHTGPVVISNKATDRIVDLYAGNGYSLRYLDAPRRIACNGNREKVREVLAVRT